LPVTSRCPKCESVNFEAVEAWISGASWPYMFIQCGSCGSVVGVLERHYIPNMLQQIADKLDISLRS
jgi:RNase P subunit RPR2